jgi:hypothetical protein
MVKSQMCVSSDSQKTPSSLYSGETSTNDSNGEYNSGHPYSGAQACHDEIRRTIKDDIGDVKQGERCRGLLCREM